MNSALGLCTRLAWMVGALGLAAAANAQSFDYTLNAGFLYTANSTTTVPVGSLLLLVDTGSGSLGSLSDGGSVEVGGMLNGTTLVLQSFATGDGLASPGTVVSGGTLNLSDSVKTGDKLAIVWLPQLTLDSTQLAGGQSYGTFTDPVGTQGSAWVVPGSGDSTSLNFETDSFSTGGPGYPESAGQANSLVLDAVPEPASYAWVCGVMALGFGLLRRRGCTSPALRL